MNLWVRSQDKRILQKVNDVYISTIDDKTIKVPDGGIGIELGIYKTKERAIEVLDEIQSLLQPIIKYEPIVQKEFNPSYKYEHFVKVGDNIEIKELSTFVYQMPEE